MPFSSNCTSDETQRLRDFLAGVPNGSIVRFNGGCYRTIAEITLTGRTLTFEGGGITELRWASGLNDGIRHFRCVGGYCKFNGFTFRGPFAYPLSGDGHAAGTIRDHQHMHAIDCNGAECHLSNSSVHGYYGDAIYFGIRSGIFATGSVTGNDLGHVGRNTVSIVAGHDIVVSGNRNGPCGFRCIDLEPNVNSGGVERVNVLNNVIDSQEGTLTRPGLSVLSNMPVTDVNFRSTRFENRIVSVRVNDGGGWPATATRILFERTSCAGATLADIEIRDVQGLTLLGNVWGDIPIFYGPVVCS